MNKWLSMLIAGSIFMVPICVVHANAIDCMDGSCSDEVSWTVIQDGSTTFVIFRKKGQPEQIVPVPSGGSAPAQAFGYSITPAHKWSAVVNCQDTTNAGCP